MNSYVPNLLPTKNIFVISAKDSISSKYCDKQWNDSTEFNENTNSAVNAQELAPHVDNCRVVTGLGELVVRLGDWCDAFEATRVPQLHSHLPAVYLELLAVVIQAESRRARLSGSH